MSDSKTAHANRSRRSREPTHPMEATSPWEWVLAVLGLVLIAGVIGYMAYYALTMPSTPPQIVVTQNRIVPNGSGYLVIVDIANHGNSTAASLLIEGELKQDGTTVETSEVTVDYVPRQSERQAGLFFNRDPTQLQLELRPMGYTEP